MATSVHYDHMTSDSDDESFVVLSSSLQPESMLEIRKEDIEQIDNEIIQKSIDSASEAIGELSKSCMNATDESLPSMPKVGSVLTAMENHFIAPNSTTSIKSNCSDMSQSEIQFKVENLIEENNKLKGKFHFNLNN